jgi:thiol-disulfide isomerase/thioredoxin
MKKKSLTGATLIAIAMSACAANHSNSAYTVTVPAPADTEGTMAYLVNFDTEAKMDSTLVDAATLTFKGAIDEAAWVRLIVDGERHGSFILEPGDIKMDAEGNASGSPLNDKYQKFDELYRSLAQEMQALPKDDSSRDQAAAIIAKFNEAKEKLAAENANNPIGYYLFLQDAYGYTPAELDSALQANPELKKYHRVQKLIAAQQRKLATSPGQMYTDFEISYNDSISRLSDYVGKGKYTLVDFWASWCGPCIRETAVIKDLYNTYKEKGLDVLGVAVWDEPANTLNAIERHQLPWPQIINAQTVPTELYGINGIPCIILFDPQGKIVSRDLQDEALRDAVKLAMEGD